METRDLGLILTNVLLAAALVLLSVSLLLDAGQGSVEDGRRELLESRQASTWKFAQGETQGDVVWDPSRQEGYLRFRDLPANDPKATQYQLWILDGKRDTRYPVDGGVFDIPAGREEVIIRIRAKLPVREATAFVITVERPGGVVVSDRKKIAALAKRD